VDSGWIGLAPGKTLVYALFQFQIKIASIFPELESRLPEQAPKP
jgi:hypothetical protein